MKQNGQAIVEVLIALGLSLLILPALFGLFFSSREGTAQQQNRIQAVSLAREIEDATRSIRESGWDTFATYALNTQYYPLVQNGTWTLTTGSESIQGYTRSVMFQSVYRDNNGVIVSSGGTLDASTRRVDVTVSWSQPIPSSVSYSFYLTRHTNMLVVDTTSADFSAGIATNTAIRSQGDGEVVLGSTGGFGDWCNPAGPIAQLDLSGQGVPNGISVATGSGHVIATVAEGGNASGVTLARIDVSDPAFPVAPQPSVSGSVSNTPKIKTNGIFNDANFGYLATDQHSNSTQGIIVDLNTHTEVGTLDTNTSASGQSVYVVGNIAYLTDSSGKLYTFNVSTKSGSHTPINASHVVTLSGVGKKILVAGSIAYIATSATTNQFQMVNVTDPTNPGAPVSVTLGNGKGATDIFINNTQTRAYIVTGYVNTTTPDFFTININPADAWYKQIVSTFITTNSMSPTGVVAVSGSRGIIVGTGSSKNYQVISLTSENVPPAQLSTCGAGGLSTTYSINGVGTLLLGSGSKRAYSYVITDDSNHELKIIEGGPGANGTDFVLDGTFTSRIFDANSISTGSAKAVWNRLSASIIQSSGVTDVKFQIAATDAVSNSCANASYTFVGPDGTASTYYTSSDNQTIVGAVPFLSGVNKNPARCFRYKGYFSTRDSTLTSQLLDMTISLSP